VNRKKIAATKDISRERPGRTCTTVLQITGKVTDNFLLYYNIRKKF
jgi:hypothetical protein